MNTRGVESAKLILTNKAPDCITCFPLCTCIRVNHQLRSASSCSSAWLFQPCLLRLSCSFLRRLLLFLVPRSFVFLFSVFFFLSSSSLFCSSLLFLCPVPPFIFFLSVLFLPSSSSSLSCSSIRLLLLFLVPPFVVFFSVLFLPSSSFSLSYTRLRLLAFLPCLAIHPDMTC